MSREYGPKKAVLNRIAYVAATWMLRSTSLRYVALQRVVKMSQRVVFFTTRINTRCTYYCFRKKRCKIIRVLRCTHLWMSYLATYPDKRLEVPRVVGDTWHVYSDSDHAGDTTVGTHRSHTGLVILLNGMPIHWKSNKQPITSYSSACAEIYICHVRVL